MNGLEDLRLSASGSPLAKQLILAGKRERPRTEAKVSAVAAAVLLSSRRAWLLTLVKKPWLAWPLLGVSLVVAGVVATSVCALAIPSVAPLEGEPVEHDIASFDVLPRVPESFVLEPEVERMPTPVLPAKAQTQTQRSPESAEARPSELDLLRAARIALANDDPAQAIVFLDRHARSYPDGALREEAAAVRVDALARAGDARAARAAAARFAMQYPNSPYAERVRSVVAALAGR